MWLKTLGTTTVVIGLALSGTAHAASSKGASAFCWQKAGDTPDCKYATMAACNKAAGGQGECVPNPAGATTGSGMSKGKHK